MRSHGGVASTKRGAPTMPEHSPQLGVFGGYGRRRRWVLAGAVDTVFRQEGEFQRIGTYETITRTGRGRGLDNR